VRKAVRGLQGEHY